MRGLDSGQQQLVIDFYDEWQPFISASAIEKDILVREAILTIKDAGQKEGCQLVFAGGTALSQAHQIIERMSEDADFRIIVPEGLSNGQTRKLLSMIKTEVVSLLDEAGFPLVGEMRGRNNNAYMMGEFSYQSRFFNTNAAMREHLKLEITAFAPITPVSELRLATIVDRVMGVVSSEVTIPTVSVIDTLADKMVGYLRRTAQERAGLTRGDYDQRLVRHLYDTCCVVERLSSSPDFDADQFTKRLSELATLTVARDVATYGNQDKAFADNPHAVLQSELNYIQDDVVRDRYRKFCETMIWGRKPSFDEAAGSFATLASTALIVPQDNLEIGEVSAPAEARRRSGRGMR